MITVFVVTGPNQPATRLHLPSNTWGNTVQERLIHLGYAVQATDEPAHPDTRDEAELVRRDELLEWAAPE